MMGIIILMRIIELFATSNLLIVEFVELRDEHRTGDSRCTHSFEILEHDDWLDVFSFFGFEEFVNSVASNTTTWPTLRISNLSPHIWS